MVRTRSSAVARPPITATPAKLFELLFGMRSDKQMEARSPEADLKASLLNAKYAALTSRARTEQAHQLVDHLLQQMKPNGSSGARGRYKKTNHQLRRGVEGLLGDLLRAQNDPHANGWIYRPLQAKSFTGENVGYRAFTQVIDGLTAIGLIEHKIGFQKRFDGFDPGGAKLVQFGNASRFRATSDLLELATRFGVDPTAATDHFITDLPKHPLQLRSSAKRNEYGQKLRGKPMRFERTPQTERLETWTRELNEFFDQFELRGGTHRGFIRIFNQGDDPEFKWNLGGRLYQPR